MDRMPKGTEDCHSTRSTFSFFMASSMDRMPKGTEDAKVNFRLLVKLLMSSMDRMPKGTEDHTWRRIGHPPHGRVLNGSNAERH